MTPYRRLLLLVAAVAVVLGGVLGLVLHGDGEKKPAAVLPQAGAGGGQALSGPASIGADVKPRTADEKKRAKATDAKLPVPLERAAARLFLVGFAGTEPAAPFFRRLADREWGGVVLERANYVDRAQFQALTGEIGVVARNAGHQVPVVAGVGLGGSEATVPSAGVRSQRAQTDALTTQRAARSAGQALRRSGLRAVLGPSGDLQKLGGPWETRGFPGQAPTVARLLVGAVDGWKQAHMAPIVGHFPGEGTASQDPELGVATVGAAAKDLEAADQLPFSEVARTAPAVQMSGALYAGYDGVTPASLTPKAVDALRREGFRGTVVSANLTATTLATGGTVGEAAIAALKAGCDVLYVPGDSDDQEAAYRTIVRAVRAGILSTKRITDALNGASALRRAAA